MDIVIFLLSVVAVAAGSALLGWALGYSSGRRAGFNDCLARIPDAQREGFEAGLGASEFARRRWEKMLKEPSVN